MTFTEKVKYVRGVLLISQKELAKELGVSNITINRWENGVINPSFLKSSVWRSKNLSGLSSYMLFKIPTCFSV